MRRPAKSKCPLCKQPWTRDGKKLVCLACKTEKRSKNRSIKVEVDGFKFDSLDEARYYTGTLKPMLERGELASFSRPAPRLYFDLGDKRLGWYTADFLLVYPDGHQALVENKSRPAEKDFRYRWLLAQALYGERYEFIFVGLKDREPQFIRRAKAKASPRKRSP